MNSDYKSALDKIHLEQNKKEEMKQLFRKNNMRRKINFIKPVLSTGKRQDHTILRHQFCKLGIVIPSRSGTVTAADQKEMPDFSIFDCLYDFSGMA